MRQRRSLQTLLSASRARKSTTFSNVSLSGGIPVQEIVAMNPNLSAHPDSDFWSLRPALVPKFWTGVNAVETDTFTIDCKNVDMLPYPGSTTCSLETEQVAARAREVFTNLGIVKLKNTGLGDNAVRMSEWIQHVAPDVMDYKGGANMRVALEKNVYDTGAPKEAWLQYHHEMAYLPYSPSTIGFGCLRSAEGKGDTYFSKNDDVTARLLKTEVGKKFKERGICYIRCLTDRDAVESADNEFADSRRVYNHWQTSFMTDCPEEAEAAANAKDLKVEWGGTRSRYMKTKFYTSAYEYCPHDDTNHLFASVADDSIWFDTWPGVSELPCMPTVADANEDNRPLKVTYGDDTELSLDELREFMEVYDMHGVRVPWTQGDIAVACNYRWAHGRPSFDLEDDEERELCVVLGGNFKRIGQNPNKW